MVLLVPLALALLAVPAVIVGLHLLRGSRQRLRVPAVFLWAGMPERLSGRQRLRRPPLLLLALQLLAALAVVLALARPARTAPEPPRHVALVFDASGSMQAADVAPTSRRRASTPRGSAPWSS
jgi:hypothetical protein